MTSAVLGTYCSWLNDPAEAKIPTRFILPTSRPDGSSRAIRPLPGAYRRGPPTPAPSRSYASSMTIASSMCSTALAPHLVDSQPSSTDSLHGPIGPLMLPQFCSLLKPQITGRLSTWFTRMAPACEESRSEEHTSELQSRLH